MTRLLLIACLALATVLPAAAPTALSAQTADAQSAAGQTTAGPDAAPLPRTWQEEQNFRAGPTPFEPLMKFWHELDAASELVSLTPLSRTLLDRPFTLVTIAEPAITNPQDAIRSGKTIVLLAPSVHGGEVSPKEAVQLVARDLVGGELRPLLEDIIVLVIPIVNPDGGEVRRRTNEAGYDMNRDYLKLESQEIQALVTQVMNEWTPDIHVDGHHGGSEPYVITYQGTLNPAADTELRRWTYENIFPRLREGVAREGYEAFDYSGPTTIDGVRGWGSTSVEPRKHHVYTGLVNSLGILLETPGARTLVRNGQLEAIPQEERYYHQIRGGVLATTAILEVAAERRDEIRTLTTASRLRAIQAGHDLTGDVVLDYELGSRGTEPVWMRDEAAEGGFSLQDVPVFLEWTPTRTTSRPAGYLLPPAMAAVLPILLDHDIKVYRFIEPATLDVEIYQATSVTTDSYFQGHYLKSVEVEKQAEALDVAAGWYWIPTAQSRGNLITYLFEPETDDNLITWGWADHQLQVTEGDNARRQRVPMIRVPTHQPMTVVEVRPFDQPQRTRYFRPY